jgi:ABC-type thiamin/hydroxymethylpyrimidine transport system permease subunit
MSPLIYLFDSVPSLLSVVSFLHFCGLVPTINVLVHFGYDWTADELHIFLLGFEICLLSILVLFEPFGALLCGILDELLVLWLKLFSKLGIVDRVADGKNVRL